ncbi:unnamed protein product [Amoebophrya sp. A120]|nr:unnamed protein product [Amoebophrya sp. A120]|eukprot:GSA120T00001944001.1
MRQQRTPASPVMRGQAQDAVGAPCRRLNRIAHSVIGSSHCEAPASGGPGQSSQGGDTTLLNRSEGGISGTPDICDVLIVGGGAGGVAVANALHELPNTGRPSRIRLFEKGERLGGSDNFFLASESKQPAGPAASSGADVYREQAVAPQSCLEESTLRKAEPCSHLQAQVVGVFSDGYLGVHYADADRYRLCKPEKAVVFACGGRPGYAVFPGNDLPGVVFWDQAARVKRLTGKKVVVVGGTSEAFRIAETLASRGADVVGLANPERQHQRTASDLYRFCSMEEKKFPVFSYCDILAASAGGTGAVQSLTIRDHTQPESSDSRMVTLATNMVVVAIAKIPATELLEKAQEFLQVPVFHVPSCGGDVARSEACAKKVAQQIILGVHNGSRGPDDLDTPVRSALIPNEANDSSACCKAKAASVATAMTSEASKDDHLQSPAEGSASAQRPAGTISSCACRDETGTKGSACAGKPRKEHQNRTTEASSLRAGGDLHDFADIEDTAIVCRCEKVRLGEIKKAVLESNGDMNAVKQLTRQGMGYCGGYQCSAAVLNLIQDGKIPLPPGGASPSASGEAVAEVRTKTTKHAEAVTVQQADGVAANDKTSGASPAVSSATLLNRRHQRPLNLELSIAALAKAEPPTATIRSGAPKLSFEEDCETFDIIVLGAGAVGTPTALFLKDHFAKVLVLDGNPSSGQGDNKRALGGVRATFGNGAKIVVGLDSVEILRNWQRDTGDNIDWRDGGYLFPLYTEEDERKLKNLLPTQWKFGLEIDWIPPAEVEKLVPGIEKQNLRGGIFSPRDGQATPYLTSLSMLRLAKQRGVRFEFCHKVAGFMLSSTGAGGGAAVEKASGVTTTVPAPPGSDFPSSSTNMIQNRVVGVTALDTRTGRLRKFRATTCVVNCLGATTNEVVSTLGHTLALKVDSHDAAVTKPCLGNPGFPKIQPLVVDIRNFAGSSSFYFYQNDRGQLLLSNAPYPEVPGFDTQETSHFLPLLAKRLLAVLPHAREHVEVRRIWRGLYANTTDGNPLVGFDRHYAGLFHAVGLGGQGFMLGPGVAKLITRIFSGQPNPHDELCLREFDPFRKKLGRGMHQPLFPSTAAGNGNGTSLTPGEPDQVAESSEPCP